MESIESGLGPGKSWKCE